MILKQVEFVCCTCRDYNKHNQDDRDYQYRTYRTESLTDACKEHVMQGHQVMTEYYEGEEE